MGNAEVDEVEDEDMDIDAIQNAMDFGAMGDPSKKPKYE